MEIQSKKITLLRTEQLFDFHFQNDWKMKVGQSFSQFHINRIEDAIADLIFPIPPHRKTVHDFIFLTEGASKRSKGLHEYEFSENTFFFLPAFQISTHEYLQRESKGFFCHFDSQIFDEVFPHNTFFEDISFLNHHGEPCVQISHETQHYFLTILERLEEIYLTAPKIDLGLVSLLLATLFKELFTLTKKQISTPQKAAFNLTKKFKNLLSQHIYSTKKLTDYADMLSISPDYLNRSVKAATGKSSHEILTDMIVLEAKVMLKQTDLNVNEIAFKLSETNPSDFIRLFKNKTSITPKKYRN